jgi:hypothetical protein
MVYLFSQLSVAACFWVVWRLAGSMLSPAYALVSVFVLEGVQYYHLHAIDFNDNTLELGLWAFTIYFFYKSMRTSSTWPWILTGIFAALGMMAKYYTAALLAPMFLFIFHPVNDKKTWATLPPYLGLLTFLLIILPHVIWLFFHNFITVTYVFERASSVPSWTNHFFFPAQFAWQQCQAFLPALVLFSFLLIGKRPVFAKQKTVVTPFDETFLMYMGLGPFVLTLLLSLFLGINLRAGWGMPLLSLWGILLVAFLQPAITVAKLRRFMAAVFLVMVLVLGGYGYSLTHSSTRSSANFPGRKIALAVTKQWHDAYHTKLAYVAGSRWVGGNIEFYSVDHPAVYIEWNSDRAPWVDVKEMRRKGAVFVWEVSAGERMPRYLLAAFPRLGKQKVLSFSWYRDRQRRLMPVKIGIAMLPPDTATR